MSGRAQARFAHFAAAGTLGTLCVLQLDAAIVVARGAPKALLLFAHVLGTAVGLAIGIALWAACAVLLALGERLARTSARIGSWPALSPLAPLVLAATLVSTYLLAPAHRVFSQHPATTALLLAYLPFPLALAFTLYARSFDARRLRVPLVLACALAALALHALNTWYYPSLYRPVHDALTGVALAVAIAGAAHALRDLAARTLARALGVALALALALLALVGAPMELRAVAFMEGTELQHTLARVQRAFDRDGDGFSPGLGGDCDDARRDVSPLHIEQPGNGRDDNCRLGDRKASGVAPSTRVSPEPRALAGYLAAHPRLNVLLVLVDTLRADVVGALGGQRGLTPELDRIAQRSTLFTQARTTAPRTEVALASVARARFHGRNLECRGKLTAGGVSLATELRKSGYASAARMIGDNWLRTPASDDWPGLLQRDSVFGVSGPRATAESVQLIGSLARPFSLFVHYADPHSPYEAHAGIARRGTGPRAAYGAEVEATDREVGALWRALEAAGRLKDTIVIVFSDHGENLGERGSRGGHHGVSVYDEDVHVPLLIYAPDARPQRVADAVSLIDIAPTVLALAGLPPLPDADGRSLAGYVLGEPPEPSWTLSEYYGPPYFLRGIVEGDHKLIVDVANSAHRLFDLAADPGELVDLAPQRPERVAKLRARLDSWLETRADPSEPSKRCF